MRLNVLLAFLCLNGIVTAGLTSHWQLDETSGSTVATDSSGSNNGSFSGGVSFEQQGADATSGTAIQFDGIDGKIAVVNNGAFDTAETTVSLWFQPEWAIGERSESCMLFGIRTATAVRINIGYNHDHSGLWTWNGTTANNYAHTFQENTWYHLVVVWNETTNTESIYINGSLIGSKTNFSFGTTANLPVQIGARDTDRFFQGIIDDVRFYNHAFTQAEVNSYFKGLLDNAITSAQTVYNNSATNEGSAIGQYSIAARANLLEDITAAQTVSNDTNSSATDFRAAQIALLAGVDAFQPLASQKLYGEIIGSFQAWNSFWSITNAFDENTNSLVFTLLPEAQAGIELPDTQSPAVIDKIRYYPTPGWNSRVVGAFFEASVDGTNWTTLHTISTTPATGWNEVDLSANTVAYRYFRLNDPDAHIHMNEIEFYAFYTPQLMQVINKPQNFIYNTSDQPLLPVHLKAKHGVLYEHNITYTLTAAPVYGVLKLNGIALTDGDTFTQKDINDGVLTFSDDASHNSDSFNFTVADTLGQSLAEATFTIVLDSDNDGLSDSDEIAGNTDWNNADTDGDGQTDGWEVANGSDPVVDHLSPAVTALQGENGISAAFWDSAPGTLAAFVANTGPQVTKKLSRFAYSRNYGSNAGGSTRKNYVVGKYETYLWVPAAGNYTFELVSDDGSIMSIEGAEVINNDGVHIAVSKSCNHNFATSGFKKVIVKYFQAAGSNSLLLYWQGPGIEKQLIPANYFYLSIPEHTALEATVDSDADFLSDIEEGTLGTDPNNADSDSDKILDGEEHNAVYGYQTNPLDSDTDSDTVNDWDEIFLFLSNPLIADFGTGTITVINHKPANYSIIHGQWEKVGDSVRNVSKNGRIFWDVELDTEGVYLVEIDVSQHLAESIRNDFSAVVQIDGMLIGRENIEVSHGANSTIRFLTPNLRVNKHTLSLFLDNVYEQTSFIINDIRFTIPNPAGSGQQSWLENHINTIAGIINKPDSSKVSPVSIEGKGKYLELIDLNNYDITINRGTWNRWYMDVPLIQSQAAEVTVSYQNGLKSESLNIIWEETNVLDGENVVIRKGDSLLLNIISGHENSGVISASVTVGGQTFTVDPDTPKEYLFDTVGTYTVTATQEAGNGTTSNGTMTVKVVDAPVTTPIHLWRFRDLTLTWPPLDTDLTLDGQGMALTDNNDGTYKLRRGEALEEINILTRIGNDGPILSKTPIQPFWLYELVEGFSQADPVEAGVYKVKDTLFLSPYAPDDIQVTVEIFVSGVTFEDGSVTKVLSKSDFTYLGLYEMVLLKDEARLGSTCHRIKVYQNGILIGQRN